MSVSPTGVFSVPAHVLRRLVANSATFQAACGVSTEADALEKTAIKGFPEQESERRPIAVVSPDGLGTQLVAVDHLRAQGSVFLYLAIDVAEQYFNLSDDAMFTALNFFGGVLEDIFASLGSDLAADGLCDQLNLNIVNAQVLAWSETAEKDWPSLGRFYWMAVQISWGDSQ